jgi:hypothetical protein
MFLSRFWYLVVAALAGAAVAAYLIAVGQYNQTRGEDQKALLIKDRVQVEALLKLDARARIDALQGIAADETVRTAMASAFNARSEDATKNARANLMPRLRTLNEGLQEVKGDFLAALDERGRAVAQIGINENVEGLGYGQFPLVEAALRGYLRDDVWRLDDKLYRVAARPIIHQGNYVGAILHGMELSSALPQRLYDKAKVQVAFFQGTNIIASHAAQGVPSPSPGELAAPLTQVLASEPFAREGRTDIMQIGTAYSGIYSRLTGEAADATYVVTRPSVSIADPVGFALGATSEATASVPWPLLAGGVVLAFAMGLFLVWLERDRPLGKLRRGLAALQGRSSDRIDVTKLHGPYRKVAIAFNEAMDRAVEAVASSAAPPVRREADLDAILGPTPGKASSSPFALPGMDAGADMVPSAPPPSPTAQTVAAKAVGPSPVSAPALPGGPPPPTPAASSGPRPIAAPPVPRPGTPAAPAPARPAPPAPTAAPPPGPTLMAPPAAIPGYTKSTMVGVPQLPADRGAQDDEEMQTVVSRVPEDVLAAASPPGGGDGVSEEEHFKKVFEEFVQTKRQCGEQVDSLTYEKFLVTLRKNKDTLVQRYHCKSVRFQVYVKDGKAALRATPVKA